MWISIIIYSYLCWHTHLIISSHFESYHWWQLKQDIVSDRLYCSTTAGLNLAALASQAEQDNHMGIRVQRYLPDRITRELEGKDLTAILSELQAKYKGLSSEQAKLRFLQVNKKYIASLSAQHG